MAAPRPEPELMAERRPTPRAPRAVGADAKEVRRQELLVAAKRVFAAKGFHATTIADVAKAAGTSYGSVYWYFESKESLFHELMDQEERALRAHIEGTTTTLGSEPDGAELFRRSVQATFEFFERDREAVSLLFRDSFALGDRFDRHLGGIYEGFVTDIEKVVVAAQAAGLLVEAPARLVAFSVAGLIGQLALRRLSTDDGLEADVLAGFVVTLLLDGLRPREEAR
jgi:AcrR family transcriptional regulator